MKEFQFLVAVYVFCKCIIANEVPSKAMPCGQEELIHCSKQIRALTATSEFNFVDNKEELDRVCPDLHTGLECIRSYTRRCLSQQERAHFSKLYSASFEMIKDLCSEGSYQADFLRYAPCMRKVKNEYEKCAETYKSTMKTIQQKPTDVSTMPPTTTTTSIPLNIVEISVMKRQQQPGQSNYNPQETTTTNSSIQSEVQIKTVCCAFQEYMKCSESAVARACGAETAEFTRNFLDKMLSSLIRLHCEEPEMRHCEEYSDARSINFNFTVTNFLIILISILFLFLF